MFEPVTPVPAQPPRTATLLASALAGDTSIRWQNGMAWRPERCGFRVRGFDPCGTAFETPGAGGDPSEIVYYRPTAFRVEDECSTRGLVDEGRVRRQALAATSWFMARELHSGSLSKASPFETPDSGGLADQVNPYLAQPGATVVPGTWGLLAAIGQLEDAARDAGLGQDVFIHMPAKWVPLIDGAIRTEGQLLLTKTGATVVADSGYPGTGTDDPGTAEVQTVTINGGPTGGTFTLTFEGETTDPIAFDALAAAVQSALEALDNLEPGDVTVTGAAGGPYTVVFADALGNVTQMTASGAGLTGGTSPTVTVTTGAQGTDLTDIGYRAPLVGSDPTPNGISVELWTRAVVDGAYASELPYFHWVLARTFLRPSDSWTLSGEDPLLPSFEGFSNQNANWGSGPAGDWPYPSDRVWQYARVASLPDLTPGFRAVA